jgi:class 3 adenylate cyclase
MAARVCSAAHGGQILVSRTSRDALDAGPLNAVGFRDLGVHQLQGMPGLEPLFQAVAADLPADFPPPRTGAAERVKS